MSETHQRQGEQQARAAPAMIDVGAQNDGAQRAHQKTRAESGERKHQRCELVAGGEKRRGDGGGVVAEDLKIVHLERVARGHPHHRHELRAAGLGLAGRGGCG